MTRYVRARRVGLLATTALLVAGCSASGADSDPAGVEGAPSALVTQTDPPVEVSGTFGETPEVSIPDADPPEELQVQIVEQGDGPPVAAGSLLVADYHSVDWESGEVGDSSFVRGEPAGFGIGVGNVIPGWDQGLVNVNVGSRALLVVPPDLAYGDQGSGDIAPDATLVFVVDVIDAISHADNPGGEEVDTDLDGAPGVSGEPGEQPTIELDGALPQSPTRHTVLIEGSGEKIKENSELVIGITQADYATEEVQSTWEGSPLSVPTDVLPGFEDVIVGQRVGTRILSEVSGADGQGTPFVAVIDVLGVY